MAEHSFARASEGGMATISVKGGDQRGRKMCKSGGEDAYQGPALCSSWRGNFTERGLNLEVKKLPGPWKERIGQLRGKRRRDVSEEKKSGHNAEAASHMELFNQKGGAERSQECQRADGGKGGGEKKERFGKKDPTTASKERVSKE